jgi:hypothetical protein
MSDVPLSVALAGNILTFVAGALPVVVGWIKDAGHDKRERAERLAAEQSRLAQDSLEECLRLLGLSRDFRVLVENAHEVQGDDLTARVQEIRQSAANISGQADKAGFRVPQSEAMASALAAEARKLADAVANNRSRAQGAALTPPELRTFDQCLTDFRAAAQAALNGRPGIAGDSADGAGGRQRLALAAAGGAANGVRDRVK